MRLTRFGDPLAMTVIAALIALLVLPGGALAQESEEPMTEDPAGATEQTDVTEPAEPVKMARVRFLHGTHDRGLAIYSDGEKVVDMIQEGQITDYMDIPAGEHLVQATWDDFSLEEGPVIAEKQLAFKPNSRTTVVANDKEDGSSTILLAVKDKPKPAVGKGLLRVVNLCANCGPVAIARDGAKARKSVVKGVDYLKPSKYVKVKPGTVDLEIRPPTQDRTDWDIEPFEVKPGSANTLFLTRWIVDKTMLPVPAVDAELSSVRFMNASRIPPVVDVWVDGKRVAKRLAPGHAAPKAVNLISGEHLVQVTEVGKKPADGVLLEDTVTFAPWPVAAEVAAGASIEAASAPSPADLAPKTKETKIRFANIDPEIGPVDIELDGVDNIEGMAVGEWTGYITFPGASSYAWIRPANDPAGIYHELPLDYPPGVNITAYLGGSPELGTVEFVFVEDPFLKTKKKRN